MPTYSLVVPAYNEESSDRRARVLASLRLMDALDGDTEAILVDDDSSDRTYERMRELVVAELRFKVVRLSRSFGHQIALAAGVDVVPAMR